MLTEAIRVASQPEAKPSVQEFKSSNRISKTKSTKSSDPIQEMINQTKATMTNEEYKNVFAGTSDMVQKPNFASTMASSMGMVDSGRPTPGLDISQFDFVKKAGAVYKASLEKDKQKAGLV